MNHPLPRILREMVCLQCGAVCTLHELHTCSMPKPRPIPRTQAQILAPPTDKTPEGA